MILMGQERIKAYNIINLLQVISFFLVLLFWLFILQKREVISYISWSLRLLFLCIYCWFRIDSFSSEMG